MRKVIFINEPEKSEGKGVEFTHCKDGVKGWVKAISKPNNYGKVVYLGKCERDGDVFAAYNIIGNILIYKGHLNNGTY